VQNMRYAISCNTECIVVPVAVLIIICEQVHNRRVDFLVHWMLGITQDVMLCLLFVLRKYHAR